MNPLKILFTVFILSSSDRQGHVTVLAVVSPRCRRVRKLGSSARQTDKSTDRTAAAQLLQRAAHDDPATTAQPRPPHLGAVRTVVTSGESQTNGLSFCHRPLQCREQLRVKSFLRCVLEELLLASPAGDMRRQAALPR